LFAVVDFIALPMMLLTGLGAVISLFVRFHRARGDECQHIKWFVSAPTLGFVFVLEVLANAEGEVLEVALAAMALIVVPSIPIATGMAILRYRLYE
jgi:hypothetical protein